MLFTNFSIVTTSCTTCPGHLLFTNISIVTTSCTTCPSVFTYPTVLLALEYYLPGDQIAGSQSHQVVINEKQASTKSCNLRKTDLRLETRDGYMMRAERTNWF